MPRRSEAKAGFPRCAILLAACAIFLALLSTAEAQRAPHIGYAYPAGGRQGTTFHVKVAGQFLRNATNAYLSTAIGKATFVEFNQPLGQNEFNDLRMKFRELLDRKRSATNDNPGTNSWTTADESQITEIQNRILKNPPNRQGNPAIAESVTLKITLAPDAEPGEYELRVGTPVALSNPLLFCVGPLPESTKPPATSSSVDLAFLRQLTPNLPLPGASENPELRVRLPATVNGQIMPGAVDRFRFAAHKGERLTVTVKGRELIPYLADAVPGWFQAALTLYDANGKEIAYDDDFRFHPDPALYFEVPRDGDYVVEIKDALYRGRDDFVYRLTLGQLPSVTGIFPLGGRTGAATTVDLTGWNLPETRLTVNATNGEPGIQRIRPSPGVCDRLPFAMDTLPECLERESNNSPSAAQRIDLPMIINGHIDSAGDSDVFRFEGKAGDEIVAEVYARRLDSPLDSTLALLDGNGKQLAFNDDREDKGSGLSTHHADSRFIAKLPANGTYRVQLCDAQRHGGSEYAYRLRISSPRPDFELRLVPSTVNVRAEANVPVTVYALRKDGFTGEITLNLKDAPAGFSLEGGRVPANQDQVRVTLRAPPNPQPEPVNLTVEGRAAIQDKEIIRTAVPCEDCMQAFAYRHLVPARELKAFVSRRGAPADRMKFLGDSPAKIPTGGTAQIRFNSAPPGLLQNFELELSNPPDGIDLKETAMSGSTVDITLSCDPAKAKPGLKGNLIVDLHPRNNSRPGAPRPRAANARRIPTGTLPAVPFEITGAAE